MNDDELLTKLQGLRPAGPPEALRARATAPRRPPRTWPWAAAAAALLVLIAGLHVSTTRISLGTRGLVSPATFNAAEAALRRALGTDAWMMDDGTWLMRLEPRPEVPPDDGL
ncbi:MAG: hypothetical protein ABI603_07665 [Acidobacteriota bacterium]